MRALPPRVGARQFQKLSEITCTQLIGPCVVVEAQGTQPNVSYLLQPPIYICYKWLFAIGRVLETNACVCSHSFQFDDHCSLFELQIINYSKSGQSVCSGQECG